MEIWNASREADELAKRFEGVSQASFAREHGVPGGASMVSQHIKGRRPLNLASAKAYARGFDVPLSEISPRLALAVAEATDDQLGAHLFDEKTEGGYSVKVLATSASMGAGLDQHDDVVVGRLTLAPTWINKTLGSITKPENLRFIHGYGDSMEPTFADGDIMLVDAGVRAVRIDGIYVLEANERLYIKRVRQRMDGDFEISSDNATVKTVDVLGGSKPVGVLGKVVWVWNGRKL